MTLDNRQEDFWQKFIEIEHGILTCRDCCERSGDDPCSPQLTWAGSEYKPCGVIFLLQNPRSPAFSGDDANRDQRLRPLLLRFRDSATIENYRLVVLEMHSQMQGLLPTDNRRWSKWTHPVTKCIKDCLTLDHLVWANVVKHRTPGGAVRNRPTVPAEQEHGVSQHLIAELNILRPSAVVAVGVPANNAMITLEGHWKVMCIKAQGSSNEEAFAIRNQIRAMGLCQRDS